MQFDIAALFQTVIADMANQVAKQLDARVEEIVSAKLAILPPLNDAQMDAIAQRVANKVTDLDTDNLAEQVLNKMDLSVIKQAVLDQIDTDEIASDVKNSIDMSDLASEVKDELDFSELASAVMEELDTSVIASDVKDNLEIDDEIKTVLSRVRLRIE